MLLFNITSIKVFVNIFRKQLLTRLKKQEDKFTNKIKNYQKIIIYFVLKLQMGE